MSVKNVTVADLALVELLGGKTDAPAGVLAKLRAKGHVSIMGGEARLTAKGKRRAQALRGAEHDLRLLFAGATAGNGAALHTDGAGTGLQLGAGAVGFFF